MEEWTKLPGTHPHYARAKARLVRTSTTDLEKRTVSVGEYINNLSQRYKEKFLKRKRTYRLDEDIIEKLRAYSRDVFIVVFSAEWCKDCGVNIPILTSLAEKANMEVRVFGGLKLDPLNLEEKWRIPPSPPEVKAYGVQDIPYIILFDCEGRQIGTIVEHPKPGTTLEEEILHLIEKFV